MRTGDRSTSLFAEEVVGHAPLAALPDAEGLGAHEVEQPPVEQPPPPLGLAVRAPAMLVVGARVAGQVSRVTCHLRMGVITSMLASILSSQVFRVRA